MKMESQIFKIRQDMKNKDMKNKRNEQKMNKIRDLNLTINNYTKYQ
jgi:hypothetical protein